MPMVSGWIMTDFYKHKCGLDIPMETQWNYCPNCGIKLKTN